MNSTAPQLARASGEQELIRFQHPDEWKGRPAFRPALAVSEANLLRFVGGYNLGKELYQLCGLIVDGKLCNQEHGHGFVVATNEGLETQVGKDCGFRHLGAKFEELERMFTAAVRAEDLLKRLRELVAKQDEMMRRAKQAISDCDIAAGAVKAFKHRIEREPTLAEVLKRAIASDGSIYGEVRASEDEYEVTRKRYRREVYGRIDGISAVGATSPKGDIQAVCLPLIHSLTTEALEGLTSKKLAALSKEAGDAERLLVESDAFVTLCRRFTSLRNWQAFASAFESGKLQTNDRGRRLLKQLVETGT